MERKINDFAKLIEGMDIPEIRKEPTSVNLKWFLRNAAIRNQEHPNIDKAINFAKENA